MNTKLIIYLGGLFVVLMILGLGCSFILFRQDRDERKSRKFFASERLLVFIVEILIAVIGFGFTLFITNAYERQIEKDKAIQMLEQVIEYSDRQVANERAYLSMYDSGVIDADTFLMSSVVNTDYFESVLTNELILQNADMNIHGEIMNYLVWIDQGTARAEQAEDEYNMRTEMYYRYAYFIKLRNMLDISCDKLKSSITTEEATEMSDVIYRRSLVDEIAAYENTD